MIEAAIFADDDDDVFDRRGGLDRVDRLVGIDRISRSRKSGRRERRDVCADVKPAALSCERAVMHLSLQSRVETNSDGRFLGVCDDAGVGVA